MDDVGYAVAAGTVADATPVARIPFRTITASDEIVRRRPRRRAWEYREHEVAEAEYRALAQRRFADTAVEPLARSTATMAALCEAPNPALPPPPLACASGKALAPSSASWWWRRAPSRQAARARSSRRRISAMSSPMGRDPKGCAIASMGWRSNSCQSRHPGDWVGPGMGADSRASRVNRMTIRDFYPRSRHCG